MKKSLIWMKWILWRTFSLLGVLFLGLFISWCSDSKITSDQIWSVMIDFWDWLLLSWEKEALLKVSKEPNFVSYFGTKDVISIWQFGSVRLDNKMWYQYTINNDQNFWLFIRSSYKSEIEHSSWYVVDCSKDSPYYRTCLNSIEIEDYKYILWLWNTQAIYHS